MRYLLDTHALLWFLEGSNQLSSRAKILIEDTENEIFVSIASFFEIAVKVRVNKIQLSKALQDIYEDTLTAQIRILPISQVHIFVYQDIPLLETHRDPFDRLLIATALQEKLPIITIDNQFKNYPNLISVVW
ncbi:MAG: type II toxin-antitoxin system VapC family toxin [Cytophagia bacterium]|jgi:PIN domain nuclease of toxin-antitoxin system|nr:MAG: type II toxin-antitoxin system VapC family toxin [Cytophagales bacterium]TAG41360.1 MAG: type II toxin-antitoxin system VapC family toxin [Cytophagia bacterium]TAG83118.1 MAG: type II toxin-antitoxin system VapC family toxin [Cytophagales bacterium]